MRGKITFSNAAAVKLLGYEDEQVLAKSVHDVLQPKRVDGAPFPWQESKLLSTLNTGTPVMASDEVFCKSDRNCVPVEYTVTPLNEELGLSTDEANEELWLSEKKEQVGALLVFRDITQQKRAVAAAEELASIVRYSTDAIIGINLDGKIMSWNQAATRIYGYPESMIRNQYFDKMEERDSRQTVHSHLARIRDGKSVEQFEARHISNDGTSMRVSITMSPIKNEVDQVTGASAIIRKLD